MLQMALGGGDAGAGSGRMARNQPVHRAPGKRGRSASQGHCMEMAPGHLRGREGGLELLAKTRSQKVMDVLPKSGLASAQEDRGALRAVSGEVCLTWTNNPFDASGGWVTGSGWGQG